MLGGSVQDSRWSLHDERVGSCSKLSPIIHACLARSSTTSMWSILINVAGDEGELYGVV